MLDGRGMRIIYSAVNVRGIGESRMCGLRRGMNGRTIFVVRIRWMGRRRKSSSRRFRFILRRRCALLLQFFPSVFDNLRDDGVDQTEIVERSFLSVLKRQRRMFSRMERRSVEPTAPRFQRLRVRNVSIAIPHGVFLGKAKQPRVISKPRENNRRPFFKEKPFRFL